MNTRNNGRFAMSIFGVTLLINSAYAAEKINLKTLCPASGSKGQTILLIDTTDPLAPVAQARLKQLLKGFGDSDNEHYLQLAHELIVYRLKSSIADIGKPLRVCNPGNPEERTTTDDLLDSPIQAKKKWRAFELKRRSALPPSDKQIAGSQSPLLESISLVIARHVPSLGVGKQRIPTRLILFSDMLQNSDLLSHYKALPNMKALKNLTGYAEMDSDLMGVDVWLFYVRRTGVEQMQTPKHYYWWTQAIEFFGGRLMEQVPL